MRSYRWIAAPVLLALGCRAPSKPAEQRVVIESELVEQVCRGTIEHAESELARMEAELELAPMEEPVEIHVVAADRIGEYCDEGDDLCVLQPPRRLYVSAEVYGRELTRELVRARLASSPVSSTKPMFLEGVATALTRPICRPYAGWDPPGADGLLSKTLATSLGKQELYLAGELARWLLDTRGPTEVLDFMATINRHDSRSEVRVAYLERFGSALDYDLYAHWRPADEPLEPERAGCVAPELARDEGRSRLIVDASFDCDSSEVRSDFVAPGQGYVEWTLTVDESTAGTYYLDGDLPDGFQVTLSLCDCRPEWYWTQYPPSESHIWDGGFHPEYGATLAPGRYRLRAYGPIGSSLHHEIIAPCDFAKQNCPAGQQCSPYGECRDQVEDPGQYGEPCSPTYWWDYEVEPCAAGLACIGHPEQSGLCLPYCGEAIDTSCPEGQICGPLSVCADPCDPIVPACEDDWWCMPNFESGAGGCYPIPEGDLGLLEPCYVTDFSCGPGLWCTNFEAIDGCHDPDPDVWIDFSGCCSPVCDPAAADPGCPPELPNCEIDDDQVLGICHP